MTIKTETLRPREFARQAIEKGVSPFAAVKGVARIFRAFKTGGAVGRLRIIREQDDAGNTRLSLANSTELGVPDDPQPTDLCAIPLRQVSETFQTFPNSSEDSRKPQ